MRSGFPFLMGAAVAAGLLLLLWAGAVCQFGNFSNSFRFVQGYNYVVDPAIIDVGVGARGDTRTAATTIRNLSFSPIRVIGVLTTCNCVVATELPLTIAPRTTVDVQFTVNLESSTAEVEQFLTLLIDDGQMQRAPVTIIGKCAAPQ